MPTTPKSIEETNPLALELELLEAELRLRKLRKSVHARQSRTMMPIVRWVENYAIVPESVNQRDFNLSKVQFASLEVFQKRILSHLFTPGRDGRLPYNRMFWSAIKKSGKCRAATDRLLLANGSWVEFGALVDKEFEVLAFDERTGNIKHSQARAFSNGMKPCWRLTTETGKEVTATENHPFFTCHGWRSLSQLKTGDKIAVPTHHRVLPDGSLSNEEVKLLAYLIAEGCLTHGFGIAQQSGPQLEEIKELCAHFNCFLKPRKSNWDGWTYSITSHVPRSPARLFRNRARELAERHGLLHTLSGEKFVPDAIFRSCDEQIALFLNRLFSGDGWATADGQNIGYCSISKRLVEDVQLLLQRLGIHGIVRTKIVARSRTGYAYSLEINDRHNVLKFARLVGIYGKEEALQSVVGRAENRWQKRAARIDVLDKALWPELLSGCKTAGYSINQVFGGSVTANWAVTREKVRKVGELLDDARLKMLTHPDIGWEEIKHLEYVGELATVGVEVPEYHTYCTSVIEHNTQLAAWILAWAACELEAPNYFLVVANSKQQSAGRIFKAALPTLKGLGHRVPHAVNSKPVIRCTNGTDVEVIANNFEDQSGAGYGR